MSKEMEDRLWYQSKSAIMSDYADKLRETEGAIASRGFTHVPGFAQEFDIKFERDTKLKLSEANIKIVEKSFEMEKANAKYYYDRTLIDYRNDWEIEKQSLLGEMQLYITGLKRLQSLDAEILDREALQIESQRTYILQAETDIKLQLESLNQTSVDIKASTIAYEKGLSDEQVNTLRKKLDLIPILNQLVAAEEDVLNRISAELIPAQLAYFEELEAYIAEMLSVLPFKENIANQEYSNSLQDIDIANHEIVVADKQIEVVNKKLISVGKELTNANKETSVLSRKGSVISAQTTNLNSEKDLSIEERDLTSYEIDNAEIEVLNSSKRIGNAEKQQEVSAKEKELSIDERATAERSVGLVEKETEYIDGYTNLLFDILETARTKRKMAETEGTLLENQYGYLELRILIQNARNALHELSNDQRIIGVEHDIDLSKYRSQTELNASVTRAKMVAGNTNSSGDSVNEDSGGEYKLRSGNMTQHDLDRRDYGHDAGIDMKKEMLDYRKNKAAADFDLRLRQTYAGTFSGKYEVVDPLGDSSKRTETKQWSAMGTDAAPDVIHDAANSVAGVIASHGRITSKLVHVLGSQ